MSSGPDTSSAGSTGPGRLALRIADFALDTFAAIFKALPRKAAR